MTVNDRLSRKLIRCKCTVECGMKLPCVAVTITIWLIYIDSDLKNKCTDWGKKKHLTSIIIIMPCNLNHLRGNRPVYLHT